MTHGHAFRSVTGLFLVGALFAFGASAALEPTSQIAAIPSSPGPGERVRIEAVTPVFDRDTTFYEWTIDGAFRSDLSGRGKYSAELVAGSLGSSIAISVRATALDERVSTMSATIRVSELTLLWSAEVVVPPWYRGKALASPRSVVRITALPELFIDGKRVDPKNLLYRWSVGDNEKFASGVGKQSIQITTSAAPGASHWIRVTVEDVGRTVKKEGTLFIVTREPTVSIYRYLPASGVELRSAEAIVQTKKGESVTLAAEPFYVPGVLKDILYRWDVGGLSLTDDAVRPKFLTIETGSLQKASTPVSVSVSSRSYSAIAPVQKMITLFVE